MKDLFGNEVTEPFPKTKTLAPNGYARRPGSGPPDQTCGTCRFATRHSTGNKSFYKCEIIRHCWTGSVRTDIVLKAPACSMWQRQPVAL